MPKPYPVEFRTRAVALVRAGKPVSAVAGAELRRARARIRELEREVEILRVATNLLGQEAPHPKGFTR